MDILSLIRRAQEAGLQVGTVDGQLRVSGPKEAGSIVRELAANKAAVIDALLVKPILAQLPGAKVIEIRRKPIPPQPRFDIVWELEALSGTVAGTPADRLAWARSADLVSGWLTGVLPPDCSMKRWQILIGDAHNATHNGWVARALSFGWKLEELFGVDRRAPWPRVDRYGLIILLGGSHIADLSDRGAFIVTPNGAHQSFTRNWDTAGTMFVWDVIRNST
jgi:hypothetical protein